MVNAGHGLCQRGGYWAIGTQSEREGVPKQECDSEANEPSYEFSVSDISQARFHAICKSALRSLLPPIPTPATPR